MALRPLCELSDARECFVHAGAITINTAVHAGALRRQCFDASSGTSRHSEGPSDTQGARAIRCAPRVPKTVRCGILGKSVFGLENEIRRNGLQWLPTHHGHKQASRNCPETYATSRFAPTNVLSISGEKTLLTRRGNAPAPPTPNSFFFSQSAV